MVADLKPIRSEADYDEALAEVEKLWGAQAGTPEGDRLDILATLIDAYEAKTYPMDPPDPVEAIRFRMEQQGLTRKDLEPMIGPRNRVADVLNRKRSLSIDMIRQLHARLGISAEGQGRLSRSATYAPNSDTCGADLNVFAQPNPRGAPSPDQSRACARSGRTMKNIGGLSIATAQTSREAGNSRHAGNRLKRVAAGA